MDPADLYLDRIDFERYLAGDECRRCGADSCRKLVEKIKYTGIVPEALPPVTRAALLSVLEASGSLPKIPKSQLPCAGEPGLLEINKPGDGAPILVSGNSLFTQNILAIVLSSAVKPFFLLSADTNGDTLDMALIFGSFTPENILSGLSYANLDKTAPSSHLIIPGHAAKLEKNLSGLVNRTVITGPVCAAELPLFFGENW